MPKKLVLMNKCSFTLEVLDYPFNLTPVKLAVLLFYLRIFTSRKFRILVYTVGLLALALHAPLGQRLGVTGVSLLGGVVLMGDFRENVANVVKMTIYLSESDFAMEDPTCKNRYQHLAEIKTNLYQTKVRGPIWYFDDPRRGLIIIAACIISIWPLFTQVMPRHFHARFSRETTTKVGNQEGIAGVQEVRPSSFPVLAAFLLGEFGGSKIVDPCRRRDR
ncbi:uncharacterized protein N7500_000756 [Penicillium coprophilum]|uniref:uncharacterized protein n=1 Tax=Penicillium coprophilum TaxID=36646 RepID=UPI0023A0F7C5|nr:uncharacterized protein N7500_000756 [Penicillium coprophilum]KAJ5178057.1 hypothetical protein N7500_000756 [Penicillium coprophilum]